MKKVKFSDYTGKELGFMLKLMDLPIGDLDVDFIDMEWIEYNGRDSILVRYESLGVSFRQYGEFVCEVYLLPPLNSYKYSGINKEKYYS